MEMARPVRIEFPGALYHVTSRGDRREAIYEDDTDRELFLEILKQVIEGWNWICQAYCLMSNHYHLVIETPEGNLSKGMRQLNGVYLHKFDGRPQTGVATKCSKKFARLHDILYLSPLDC